MGDLCMKFIANIVSFISMIVGTLVSVLAKLTPILDDSISTIAAVVGLAGAVIWFFIAINRLKNEKLETRIKKEQLKNLQSDDTNPANK